LHRAALLGDFPRFLADIRVERDALENDFRLRVARVLDGGSSAERAQEVARCWLEAASLEERWLARMSTRQTRDESSYHAAWREMNRIAALDLA
jgi:hypothetical protein